MITTQILSKYSLKKVAPNAFTAFPSKSLLIVSKPSPYRGGIKNKSKPKEAPATIKRVVAELQYCLWVA